MRRKRRPARTIFSGTGFLLSIAALAFVVMSGLFESEIDPSAPEPESACLDFQTIQEAQDFFEREGGPALDPYELDADNDGFVCERAMGGRLDDRVVLTTHESGEQGQGPPAGRGRNRDQGQGAAGNQSRAATRTPPPGSAQTGTTPTTATAVGSSSDGLPRTGSPVQTFAIVALSLLAFGFGLSTLASARGFVPARQSRSRYYTFIGW